MFSFTITGASIHVQNKTGLAAAGVATGVVVTLVCAAFLWAPALINICREKELSHDLLPVCRTKS